MQHENGPVKLNIPAWLIEEQSKTETILNHLRNILGTYRAEKDPTYNYLEGYLAALARAIRQEDI